MKRKEVRNAIVELLKGSTIAGDRVYENRSTQMPRDKLPAINIYTKDEDVAVFQVAPRILLRTLKVTVELLLELKNTDVLTLSDILDDFAEQIENAMDANEALEDDIHEIRLVNVNLNLISEGAKPIAGGTLDYEVDYLTEPALAEGTYSEFKKINVSIRENESDEPLASDEINFPQT